MPVNENIFPMHLKEIPAKQANDIDLRSKIKINPRHFQKIVIQEKAGCIKH